MHECELSITLQQSKLKVIKLTQTQATSCKDGIPGNSWRYWFKCKHLGLIIKFAKGTKYVEDKV
jgi:hypothetical protein